MKKLRTFILIIFALFFVVQPVYAGSWGEISKATFWKQTMERLYQQIDEMVLSQIKIQAAVTINKKVQLLVYGSGGGGYITNYQDFIYNNAQRQGQMVTTDVFRSLNAGVSGSVRSMNRNVEIAVKSKLSGTLGKANIDNLVNGGTDFIFDPSRGGGTTAFVAALANPYNNPFGTYLKTSEIANETIRQNQIIAQTEAVAGQGFLGVKDSNNLISLPGSTMEALSSSALTIKDQIVAAANSTPQILSAMASSILNSTIQMGFQTVTQPMDKVLLQVNAGVRGGIKTIQTAINAGQSAIDIGQKAIDQGLNTVGAGINLNTDIPLNNNQQKAIDQGLNTVGADINLNTDIPLNNNQQKAIDQGARNR